eukprot:scaffold13027_cov22-Tisochrysis_lutea.AAC.4
MARRTMKDANALSVQHARNVEFKALAVRDMAGAEEQLQTFRRRIWMPPEIDAGIQKHTI